MLKRPLVTVCIFYILGIISSKYLSLAELLIMSIIFFAFYIMLKFNAKNISLILICLITINFSNYYSNIKMNKTSSKLLQYSGQNVKIEATFIEKIKSDNEFLSFLIMAHSVNGLSIKNEKVRVNYYFKNKVKPNFNYGDLIVLQGELIEPDSQRNPGGFDYEKYLLTKNIYMTMSSKSVYLKEKDGGQYNNIKKLSIFIKKRIVYVIQNSLPQKESGLLQAILLSKKDTLDELVKADFQNAGLTHLMAVSGLHVGYIVLLFLFIFKKLRIKDTLGSILLTIILFMFILITGGSPSVIRASIMALLIIYAKLLRRKSDVLTSLAFSAIIMLLYNPITLYDIGFQLSFGATLSIVLFYNKVIALLNVIPKYIREILGVTLSAQIGIIPIMIYNFNKLSIISIFTNILAVPLAGVVVILGLCMIILGQIHLFFANFIGFVLYFLLNILMGIARLGTLIPYSNITIGTPGILEIFFYYFCIYLFLYRFDYIKSKFNKKTLYKVSIPLVLIIIVITIYKPPLEISFIDVGQGDAIFVKTPNEKVVLVDVGGESSENFNSGERVIVPFLLDKSIKMIDIIILSHTDMDHICGLASVLDNFKVKTIIMSKKVKDKHLINLIKSKNVNIVYIKNYGKIDVEKNIFIDLYALGNGFENKNDGESIVAKLNYKNRKFLFAGDISVEAEKKMMLKYNVESDVLKVGHHGSETSSSNKFLEKVNGEVSVISVGRDNKFNHPSGDTVERLKNNGFNIFRTDRDGCVSVFSNGGYLKVKTTIGDNI